VVICLGIHSNVVLYLGTHSKVQVVLCVVMQVSSTKEAHKPRVVDLQTFLVIILNIFYSLDA
jgi:hypothetical protein